MGPSREAAAIRGNWVSLRALTSIDYATLFQWHLEDHEFQLVLSSPIGAFDDFVAKMDALAHRSRLFLSLDAGAMRPIGFVQAYSFNPQHGWCFARSYTRQDARSPGQVSEPYLLFFDYMFNTHPLRKIYSDSYAWSPIDDGPLAAAGFREEGRLHEHTWFRGSYWDLVRLALYRDEWLTEGRQRLATLVSVAEELEPAQPNGVCAG
jgi:RimJ/RimL family protein N-acetyltransferase